MKIMINKNLIIDFIEKKYINEDKFNLVPSNKVHKLFCTIYNLTEKDINIRIFIPFLKKILDEKGWSVKSKKIRLKEQKGLPRNCLIGLSINMDLGPKKEQMKEQVVPTNNTLSAAPIDKLVKNNNPKVQKKERPKNVDLRPFIKEYYIKGEKKDRLGSDGIHTLCLEYYKNDAEIIKAIESKSHFTQSFKKSWDLIHPDHHLITDNIRDPKDRKKRGIACIKKKGS